MTEIKLPKHIKPYKARLWCKNKLGPSQWFHSVPDSGDESFWTADNGTWRMRPKLSNESHYTREHNWFIYFQNEQDAMLFSLEML